MANFLQQQVVTFSPDGKYLAQSNPSGSLKIWDSVTGVLKQEYAPSAHLSSTCSCISWGPSCTRRISDESPVRKKRKSSVTQSVEKLDLIAMGTTSGSLLLYSVVKADLHTQLTGGHTGTVNGICWHPDCDTVYSVASDSNIIEWSVSKSNVRHKWKGDKGSLYSVCLCHTRRHLLTAGRHIKLWDLETRQVLKTFTGHATEVFRVLDVPSTIKSRNSNGDGIETSVEGSYIVSSGVGDRLISVWQVNSMTDDKNVIASLSLPDEPVQLNVSCPDSEDQPLRVVAVTRTGQLIVFEHVLNGRRKRPLVPKYIVHVATNASQNETPRPLPVVASVCAADVDRSILIAYGDFLRPVVEKLTTKDLQPETCLVRDDPKKTGLSLQTDVTKVKVPQVSKDMTVLAPGHMAPSAPIRNDETSNQSNAKKKSRRKSKEMSMEERMAAMGAASTSVSQQTTPRTDCYSTILTQGLQSQDKKILNNVLQKVDERVILSTVRSLPLAEIVPLLKELSRRLSGHAQSALTARKWLKGLLTVHASYLMTLPDRVALLAPIHQMMSSRFEVFSQVCQIQGKLGLSLSQTTSREKVEEEWTLQPTLLSYQDESSDEDMTAEDSQREVEFSEDDWEDRAEENVDSDDAESAMDDDEHSDLDSD